MRFKDKREDAMLESVIWTQAYMVGIGNGVDPKWLEIKAQREADHVKWLLEGCPGFKGVKVCWPRNYAVFETPAGAMDGKKALETAGIECGDILVGKMLPDLRQIQIKHKWEDKKR